MSDRMNDVLAAIDAVTTQCICGRPVPENGPSLDYCSDVCQYGYTARGAGAASELEGAWRISHDVPDGRTLNEQVARELARPALPGVGEHYADAMHSDSSTRDWNNPDERSYDLVDDNRPTTRVMWVPTIANPNAPTAAEIRQGIDLTASIRASPGWVDALEVINASMSMSAIEAMEQVAAAAGMSALEAARAFTELTTAFVREPLTGEEFRRRALEHVQNRGTGPAQRRHRLPRDHGPRRRL